MHKTIALGRERIRIENIDAPESFHPRCERELVAGLKAKERLAALIRSGPVVITGSRRLSDLPRQIFLELLWSKGGLFRDHLMIENRTAPRLRSLLKGKIVYNNRMSTMDCVVRDISAGGARLAVVHHNMLPERFELFVPLKETTYEVQIRWRADEDIGVMFVDEDNPPFDAGQAGDLTARVAHLEAEVAALHKILEKLMDKLPS